MGRGKCRDMKFGFGGKSGCDFFFLACFSYVVFFPEILSVEGLSIETVSMAQNS